jgi:hypothetical protein
MGFQSSVVVQVEIAGQGTEFQVELAEVSEVQG